MRFRNKIRTWVCRSKRRTLCDQLVDSARQVCVDRQLYTSRRILLISVIRLQINARWRWSLTTLFLDIQLTHVQLHYSILCNIIQSLEPTSCFTSPLHAYFNPPFSSPFSSSITHSLFHSKLITYLFAKSFPP